MASFDTRSAYLCKGGLRETEEMNEAAKEVKKAEEMNEAAKKVKNAEEMNEAAKVVKKAEEMNEAKKVKKAKKVTKENEAMEANDDDGNWKFKAAIYEAAECGCDRNLSHLQDTACSNGRDHFSPWCGCTVCRMCLNFHCTACKCDGCCEVRDLVDDYPYGTNECGCDDTEACCGDLSGTLLSGGEEETHDLRALFGDDDYTNVARGDPFVGCCDSRNPCDECLDEEWARDWWENAGDERYYYDDGILYRSSIPPRPKATDDHAADDHSTVVHDAEW
jgi:hypothetical protein